MDTGNNEESFFLKSINVENIFEFIGRTDYFFIYNIKECMKNSECSEGVYLSELADSMGLSITDTSKAVKGLEDNGYVTWKLDEKREKTYIVLTNKAVELSQGQKRKMKKAYEKITRNISKEELDITISTLSRIRKLLQEG